MTKHTPLPSDPDAKAAEKRRRFAVYHKAWRERRRLKLRREALARHTTRREMLADARDLHLDLCLPLADMSDQQLRAAIETVTHVT